MFGTLCRLGLFKTDVAQANTGPEGTSWLVALTAGTAQTCRSPTRTDESSIRVTTLCLLSSPQALPASGESTTSLWMQSQRGWHFAGGRDARQYQLVAFKGQSDALEAGESPQKIGSTIYGPSQAKDTGRWQRLARA